MDQLEHDVFFAACARRLWAHTEEKLDPAGVRGAIRICDLDGHELDGPNAQYHSHGFDWGKPKDPGVENLVVAGNLAGTARAAVRLFVVLNRAA